MRHLIYCSLNAVLLCFAIQAATVSGQPTGLVPEIESPVSRAEYPVFRASLRSGFCPTEELVEDWATSEWKPDRITRSSCDEQGNQIESVMQIWDVGGWVYGARVYRHYDAAGNLLEWVSQERDGSEWIHYTRGVYVYDDRDNQVERLGQKWDGSQWVNTSRITDYYDSVGRWAEGYTETWDGHSWVYSSARTGTYDERGNQTQFLIRFWRDGQWIDGYLMESSYDDFGNLVEWVSLAWDGAEWLNSSRRTNLFDSSARVLQMIDYSWSDDVGWVPERLWDQSYDSNGNMVELLVMLWQQDDWVNRTRHSVVWNAVGVGRVDPDLNVGAPSEHALHGNYPNPFNPSTSIRFDLPEASEVRLLVFDLLGREVATVLDKAMEAGQHSVTWEAVGLPSGVYLYRLEAGEFVETRQSVLLK